jgi:hypothetical protein
MSDKKVIKYAGMLFFFFMLLFAIFFANERIIHSDAAFYLFKLINFENFNIEHERYSAFISQVFILPFIKIGLSLKSLIYIYSISFIVLFYLVFILLYQGLKDEAAALTLLMILVIGMAHPMYRPVSESTQGLVYSIILAGVLWYPGSLYSKRKNKRLRFTLSLLVIILCYFSHPITLFPLVFIIGFYIVDKKEFGSWLPWALLFFIIILYGIKSISGGSSGYEEEKLRQLTEIKHNILNFSNIYSTQYLKKRITTTYFIPLILLFLLNLFYLMERKWLKLLLLDGFCIGFFAIHNLVFMAGSDIELEKNFMTANFFIFFAFSRDLFFWTRGQVAKILFLLLILGWSAKVIIEPQQLYKDRIIYYKTLDHHLQTQDGSKFFTTEDQINNSKILYMWGVGFESLLISSLNGPEFSKTIYPFRDTINLPEYIEDPNLYLCVFFWPQWDIRNLNEKYFKLPQQKYIEIELPEEMH